MRSFSPDDILGLLFALRWTVLLVGLALLFGAPLALLLARLRTSEWAPARWLAAGVLQAVQGVPLLCMLMFVYFGLPIFLGLDVPALAAVTVAFAIYTGVFLGDIWRGGLQAVKHAQWEAAACLGMTRWQQFRYIIAPQAFRLSLPATAGFLVQLVKGTSLASVVGFVELARSGQMTSAATLQPLVTYSCVAALYFAVCFPLTLWSRSLEARLDGAR